MSIKNIIVCLVLSGAYVQSMAAMMRTNLFESQLLDELCVQVKDGKSYVHATKVAWQYCQSDDYELQKKAFALFRYLVRQGRAFRYVALIVKQEPEMDVKRYWMECRLLKMKLGLLIELVKMGKEVDFADLVAQKWLQSDEANSTYYMTEIKQLALKIYQVLEAQGVASEALAHLVQCVCRDKKHEYYRQSVQVAIVTMYKNFVCQGIALERACVIGGLCIEIPELEDDALIIFKRLFELKNGFDLVTIYLEINEVLKIVELLQREGDEHYLCGESFQRLTLALLEEGYNLDKEI